MRRPRLSLLAAVTILSCACASPTPPASSIPPSLVASDAGTAALPPGCEPIDLRTSQGERLELDGIWIQEDEGERLPMHWWFRTAGDCVWASGVADTFSDNRQPDDVQHLNGTLREDFTIVSEIIWLGTHPSFATPGYYAEVDMIIDEDADGRITLREDREPNVIGPRCPAPEYCPVPLLLRPADAAGG